MNSLEILAKDLKLIIQSNFKIFVAIDFADIFEYCYPFYNQSARKHSDERIFEKLLERQLSRDMLFYKFKSLYSSPILLLPPYLAESIDVHRYFNKIFTNYEDGTKREYIADIFKKYEESHNDIAEILNLINRTSPEIAFILGPSFREGFSIYKELMENIIETTTNEIDDYYNNLLYISDKENREIEDLINTVRPYSKNLKRNRRDAKAIQYVIELNNIIINDKKLLILVSNAPYFRIIEPLLHNKLSIQINQENISLLRNTDFLYAALIRLAEALGSKTGKIDLSQFNPRDLQKIVESDLKLINTFYEAHEAANALGLSGTLKDEYVNDHIDIVKFKKLIESRRNLNVMTLINGLLDENEVIEHLLKLDVKYENLRTFEEMKTIIESDMFSQYIDSKRIEIQNEIRKLENILGIWVTYDKETGPEKSLINQIWDKLEPDLQDALSLAYNQACRDGVDLIRTRYFFSAIARLAPEPLPQLIEMLPKNTLPKLIDEKNIENSLILKESPQFSSCLRDSLVHLSQKATKEHRISSIDVFVDIAKYGTGKSVKRLRTHGVTPDKIEEIVEQLGWELIER